MIEYPFGPRPQPRNPTNSAEAFEATLDGLNEIKKRQEFIAKHAAEGVDIRSHKEMFEDELLNQMLLVVMVPPEWGEELHPQHWGTTKGEKYGLAREVGRISSQRDKSKYLLDYVNYAIKKHLIRAEGSPTSKSVMRMQKIESASNTRFNVYSINCISCNVRFEFTLWKRMHGNEEPAFKMKVLDGSYFQVTCPDCKNSFSQHANFYYSDTSKKVDGYNGYTIFFTTQNIENERDNIESMLLLKEGKMRRIHVATSVNELQYLINQYDSGSLPPETIIKTSRNPQKNMQHEDSTKLQAQLIESTIAELFREIESGKVSDDFVEKLVKGRNAIEKDKSWWRKLFK